MQNPFIITEKIIPEYFCDRKKESAELIKLLKNGNNVVLISPRRLGKTGLIQYCFEQPEIKKDFLTIYIDILSTTNLQEFTYILGREIFDAVRSKGEKVWRAFFTFVKSLAGKVSLDPISGFPTFNIQLGDISRPVYTLKEIFEYLGNAGKPVIMAIDEFQQIVAYPEKNVEALLRSHLLQINNCRMIFSGSERHILSSMFMESSRPFYLSASFMELPVIPKEIYVEFIQKMFKKGAREINIKLALEIYEMFYGVTFYIQRICNGIFANTAPGEEATEEILQDTLQGILSSFDTIFRMRLSQTTLRQKELLFAVAQENEVSQITSTDFINRYSLSSASAVQTALKSLVKNNIIVKNEKGFMIEDLFFRMWIRRNF